MAALRPTLRATSSPARRYRLLIASHGSPRSFTASAGRQSAFLDALTTPPIAYMNLLHTCGLPWWAIIPSVALTVRGCFYFLTFKRSHRRAQMRQMMMPVARAQLDNERTARGVLAAMGMPGKEPEVMPKSFWERTPFAVRTRSNMLAREVDPALFKRAYLATTTRIGAWLLANEAIRMKLGMETAFLRLLWESVAGADEKSIGQHTSQFDPATQTQGFPWCTDLTTADPTGVLQTSLMLASMHSFLAPPSRKYTTTWSDWFKGITQQQWTLVLVMGVVYTFLWKLPAGLHLYWLSSQLIAKGQQAYLNMKHPMEPIPQKCKIGIQHRVEDIRPSRISARRPD